MQYHRNIRFVILLLLAGVVAVGWISIQLRQEQQRQADLQSNTAQVRVRTAQFIGSAKDIVMFQRRYMLLGDTLKLAEHRAMMRQLPDLTRQYLAAVENPSVAPKARLLAQQAYQLETSLYDTWDAYQRNHDLQALRQLPTFRQDWLLLDSLSQTAAAIEGQLVEEVNIRNNELTRLRGNILSLILTLCGVMVAVLALTAWYAARFQRKQVALQGQLDAQMTVLTEQNAELEAQHEELTSANEELMSSFEELRVANEQIEQMAEQLQVRYQAAVELIPTTFIIYGPDLRFRYVNRKAASLIGQPADQIIGKTPDEALTGAHKDNTLPLLQQALRTGKPQEREFTATLNNGEIKTLVLTYTPLLNEAGTVTEVIGMSYDITERAAAEREVKRVSDQLQDVLESMGDGFFAFTSDWTLTVVNRGFEAMLNRRRADIVGQNLWDIFPDAVSPELQFKPQYTRVLEEQTAVHFEGYYPGVGKWFEVDAYPLAGGGASVFFRDVTVRKETEQQLRASERRFRSIAANFPNGAIHIINRDGTLEFIDGQELKVYGLDASTMIGKKFPDAFYQEPFRTEMQAYMDEAIGGQATSWISVYSGVHYTFAAMPVVNEDGSIERIQLVSQNVNERILAQRELAASEQRLRNLADNLPNGLIDVINLDGTVEWVAGSLVAKLGGPQEIIGKKWPEDFYPEEADREVVRAGIKEVAAGRESQFVVKFQGQHYFHAVVPIREADGSIQRFQVLAQDITLEMEAKEHLARNLQEKEVLLAEIHHRVKNNLAIVAGLLQLQAQDTNDPQVLRFLHESRARIQAMAIVHERLYQSENLSRIEFAEYVSLLLNQLTRLYQQPDQEVQVVQRVDQVFLDIGEGVNCGLILTELVSNAFKHAYKGRPTGTLQIEATQETSGKTEIRITDNGNGLPAEFESRITKSLGLRLVYGLTSQMSGKLDYQSSESGTVWHLIFQAHSSNSMTSDGVQAPMLH